MFDYYYGSEAEQFAFYRIPKVLFEAGGVKDISTDAKVLYGLMLDRMQLSAKNNWVDEKGRVKIEILSSFNDYNLSKVVFQKYDVTLLEDIFIDDGHGVEYVYILNAHVPNTGFLTMQNNPTIYSTVHYIDNFGNRTFTNYARQVIVNKYSNDKEDIKNQINKYYKNGFLANQFIRQYRNRLNRKLKMCYISDLYNRCLYEDCIELMGKKLEEYFSIVCGLNGSLEEMANEYFNNFEPNIIEKGIVYDSTLNLDGVYQEERGMINRSISTLINHIIYLYNRVLNNEYKEGRDKVFESELNLLGNIYDETVIHLSNISDD